MKSLFTFLAGMLIPCALFAQINFQQFPKPLELFPRDLATNTATVQISGVAVSNADSLIFTREKSDGTLETKVLAVNELVNNSFQVNFEIEAGLWSYQFKVESKTGNALVLIRETSNIVAGDVFMVEGQSNAQAVAYNGDANIWQRNFIRSFGTSNPGVFDDTNWYIAEGNGYFTPGAIGQWALRMGQLLQENLHIPVAIINGADPGKPIEFFQRNDAQPLDSTTNYGRLLQRMNNAGLRDKVRSMLYYQGESDGDRALIHKTLFEALHADWEENYPNIEAYYVVQVREGCGAPSLQLREYQRAFEDYLPNTKAVTANGIDGHDGCHYAVAGYGTLGEKFYKQISADLYGMPTGEQTNIRVLSAAYSNDLNTQITVETDAATLIAQPGSAYDFKINGAGASVIGIQANGNKLILDLDQSVNSPVAGLSYGGHSGSGAWVLNGDGYGMFTFYNLLISNYNVVPNFDIPGIMSGSGNCISLDGADDYVYAGPVLSSSYTKEAWINWQGGNQLNNLISGASGTAFWAPNGVLASGHNGEWFQVSDNVVLTPNQWVHVAVTYDAISKELSLYKNGKLVSQAQNIPGHTDPEIYAGAFGGCCTFQGRMDEVRVWSTVQTMEEIRANMCRKLPEGLAGLSAYFRFDETGGNTAPNMGAGADGQLTNFQGIGLNEAWRRSGAPIGTTSAHTYKPVDKLRLSLASGDSLVLTAPNVADFVHLYFVEEVPNVLEPAAGYSIVDNSIYFGLFYTDQSIPQFSLQYFYEGNSFAGIQAENLGLLQRRNNAQSYWDLVPQFTNNPLEHNISGSGSLYHEYILALRDSLTLLPLNAQVVVAQGILCNSVNNGAISVSAQGGQAPYTYSLNGSTPQATGFFTGLSAGNYSVLVMDQSGNSISSNQVVLQNPDPLVVTISLNENNASVNIEGGTPPYQQNSNAPNPDLQNLPSGTYTLMVTDANGCPFNTFFTIDYQALTSTTLVSNPDLCDTFADLVVETHGGEPPYQYSLDNQNFQTSNTFQDLTSGTYSVYVVDFAGNTIALSTVDINLPEVLLLSLEATNDRITAIVAGGTAPYTYSINGAPVQSDSIFSGLLPGNYTVVVTDASGCSSLGSATILVNGTFSAFEKLALGINPNPGSGIFELYGAKNGPAIQVSIWNMTGSRILGFEIPALSETVLHKFDLTDQPDGIYLLQLSDGTFSQNIRLVKIR